MICTECHVGRPRKPSNLMTCYVRDHPEIDFPQLEADLCEYLEVFDLSFMLDLQNIRLKR